MGKQKAEEALEKFREYRDHAFADIREQIKGDPDGKRRSSLRAIEKSMEETLKRSERVYRALMETVAQLVLEQPEREQREEALRAVLVQCIAAQRNLVGLIAATFERS